MRRAIEGRSAWHHGSKILNKRVAISKSRPGAEETYLRLAKERARPRACVRLLSMLGLYEDAVELALEVRVLFCCVCV